MGERRGTKGLELWCKKMTEGYPGVKIDNMTTSWRDGLAFCAMIHHFRPDLIDFDKLNKADIYHNNELAFRVAEHHLGIPALLEPEDMVEYEVPDRLSILTYLSQFYQTFENQRGKSSARIAPKRPQTSPDHGIVSPASTSPPTKVQITVGRAKREPCAKCGLPVFIAERLNVGKLLYHRTCFRCARCNSQLTLANYYETENNEFCCEICPDEEKIISKKLSSEHSVLMRSMSDEEKTANLQTHSEIPDAYSTHFETALEFPVDGELKRNFTLTDSESTEFSKARSHFFQSQIEDSSDSDDDDEPPDLPQSMPPPLTKSISGNVKTNSDSISNTNSDSSFPNNSKDFKNVSDSVSEQTNNHFVTKDNVSSNSSISVKARMKLFENNEDKKSDVNISSSRKVPSVKKKATVVAIDDLEDFDNISKKDVIIVNTPEADLVNKNYTNIHSNSPIDESAVKPLTLGKSIDERKDSNLALSESRTYKSNMQFTIKSDNTRTDPDQNVSVDEEDINKPVNFGDDIIEIVDSSQEQESSHITIDSVEIRDSSQEQESSHITIDSVEIRDSSQERESSHITIDSVEIRDSSQDQEPSYITKDSAEFSVVTEEQEKSHISIEDSPVLSSHQTKESILTSPDSFFSSKDVDSSQKSSPVHGRGYYTAYEILSPPENINTDDSLLIRETHENATERIPINKFSVDEAEVQQSDYNEQELPDRETVEEPLSLLEEPVSVPDDTEKISADPSHQTTEHASVSNDPRQTVYEGNAEVNKKSESDYPETLNPFGDDTEEETSAVSTSLNPFEDSDDEKEPTSPKPVPAARPKKKIIPSLEEREIKGTPEALSRIYVHRISRNPFEDDEDEEEERVVTRKNSLKPVPSPRQKRKLAVPLNISLNPFESDDEDGNVPIPAPRTSRSSSSRPEPKARDTLSITSRGSHGGSNSSISSGSAVGSARKKKPAPRPPLPFRNSEPTGPASITISPSPSVTQSPSLSGTIRSRKTRRAPLPPPNTSTPLADKKEINNTLSAKVSPISQESTPNKRTEDQMQIEKTVKDKENRNRQSQTSSDGAISNDNDSNPPLLNKSASGRWKRRKGPAPSRPIPQRRITKTLPMSEIKRELDTIEIQQQGLEKQGVRLEQIIREKCEGDESVNPDDQVPIEVEDLILQLFELVNEKNELFRRQAELMYLRRQQRLEEEHADVEYQIRCLMLQPEANKTDSDKAREEALINRLVDIVERRNEIIECLEMDRVREAEEDNSISSQLNLYSLKRDADKDSPKSEQKVEKKKKHKKLSKIIHTLHKHKEKDKEKDYKVDIDKDVDETEVNSSTEKKKKKKFNIF